MKKVLLFGGGTGLSNLLTGINMTNLDISIGVVITDNGGSTGKIRDYYNIPAPGDLRKVINSFITDTKLKSLVEYRFDEKIQNHTIGNLFLTALVDICGDMQSAVEKYCEIFGVDSKVYPITNESVHLHGKMEFGKHVIGETQISDDPLKINKVFYNERVSANPKILEQITEADYIVFSPGSLYTSLIPNLIISEVKERLRSTKAKKIYICNIMTQEGETIDFKVSDHIKAIEKHTFKGIVDIVIANNDYNISDNMKKKYEKENSKLVKLDKENIQRSMVVEDSFIVVDEFIRHNVPKVQQTLGEQLKGEYE